MPSQASVYLQMITNWEEERIRVFFFFSFFVDKLDERIHSLQKMGEMHVMKAGHTRN